MGGVRRRDSVLVEMMVMMVMMVVGSCAYNAKMIYDSDLR